MSDESGHLISDKVTREITTTKALINTLAISPTIQTSKYLMSTELFAIGFSEEKRK